MSSDERSPKRQRTSYRSPQSPGQESDSNKAHFYQPQPEHTPQTPPPSVHMSPTWQSQQTSQSQEPGQGTIPTPPSTAGFQSQMNGRKGSEASAMESGQHTPARSERRDNDGDAEMGGILETSADRDGKEDVEHRRTDHERQEARDKLSALPLFRLSREPILPSRPHPSQDLISLYSMSQVQKSVARKDEHGNKINKLRKSYEGKTRALGIEGKAKSKAMDVPELRGMVDPQWDTLEEDQGATWWELNHQEDLLVDKKGITNAGVEELMGSLDAAFSFAPGQLPKDKHESWKRELGLDDALAPLSTSPSLQPATKTVANNLIAKTAPVRNSAPASPRNISGRPGRAGAKRRYDESSYEGYDDDGYTTGGDGKGSKRSKRNDFPNSSSPPFNPNMVGIKSS